MGLSTGQRKEGGGFWQTLLQIFSQNPRQGNLITDKILPFRYHKPISQRVRQQTTF